MSDDTLVARYLETRDPQLFRALVEEHQERVFRLVASVLGPWADLDAEEVTQEVFLRVYGKLDQWRGKAAFGSWLYRVAYTTALNHRQRARVRLPHVPSDHLEGTADRTDLFATASGKQDRDRVAAGLEQLPDLYRTVLHLYYWLEASVAEIAELLGAPEGTVKSYLARARAALRLRLGEQP